MRQCDVVVACKIPWGSKAYLKHSNSRHSRISIPCHSISSSFKFALLPNLSLTHSHNDHLKNLRHKSRQRRPFNNNLHRPLHLPPNNYPRRLRRILRRRILGRCFRMLSAGHRKPIQFPLLATILFSGNMSQRMGTSD